MVVGVRDIRATINDSHTQSGLDVLSARFARTLWPSALDSAAMKATGPKTSNTTPSQHIPSPSQNFSLLVCSTGQVSPNSVNASNERD